MKTTPLPLSEALVIDIEKKEDERGFFARTWCAQEFRKIGLNTNLVQQNMSYNKSRGTLRGMHFQTSPHAETKVIRCTRGSLYDVIIDLRPTSPTYTQWFGTTLSQDNYQMLYVPEGFAHGFITLEDDTEASYLVTAAYNPDADSGVRYNDPAFNIIWPIPVTKVSEKDAHFSDFQKV
jgi:dTDP-4-dehydrorhamnose 3,5-epimerase